MPLGLHLENVRVSTFFVALRNFVECWLGVHGENPLRISEFKSRPLHSNLWAGTLADFVAN
ncbi:MAG: hypothetical protein M3209_02675 [Acidobacteriota bacterium]|nr:hypothetical protein [Acidobacteriota bacterium]